jgi:hypothetical protein
LEKQILSDTPTGYSSSVEALLDLLSSCHITDISTHISLLANGIEYSFVQVTCKNGEQYGLQAYGIEARELHRVACENNPKEQHRTSMVVLC